MTRGEAEALLRSHIKAENLVRHMKAVEAAMRAYARRLGEDEEAWGLAGLLHDIDYEEHPSPEEHAVKGAEWLAAAGLDGGIVYAVKAHGWHNLPREDAMSRALWAVDELTGFVAATALVRPSKKIADVEVKSVVKKMKDKSFAAAVNRDELREGAEVMGLEFAEHVGVVLEAMKGVAEEIGL